MVQTSISTQTKVTLVASAAIVTGLAAYALGYVPDVSISLDSDSTKTEQVAPEATSDSLPSGTTPTNSAINPSTLSLLIDPKLPDAIAGVPYEIRVKANSTNALQWFVVGGALPAGLVLDENGLIHGTPMETDSAIFTLKYTEAGGVRAGSSAFTLDVTSGVTIPAKIATVALPDGKEGSEYKVQLTVEGFSGGVRWLGASVVGLPNGLSLSADGILQGTPTQSGTFLLQSIQVISQTNPNLTATTGLTVVIAPKTADVGAASDPATTANPVNVVKEPETNTANVVPVSTITESLNISGGFPDGTIGQYYDAGLPIGLGGKPPYSWIVSAGNLPSGLSFANDGRLSGYPNQYGIYTFTIQVRDQNGLTASVQRSIQIRPTQPNLSYSNDVNTVTRLRQIDFIGVQVHDLIKLQDDGNPYTQNDTTVYYIGADGRRHFFPNPHVYFSWFPDYSRVRIIAPREMGQIPLGSNVTYRPGTRLVKFRTDPKVYAVSSNRELRWLSNESVAIALYGPFWMRQVDDIADDFFSDYQNGAPIVRVDDYNVSGALGLARYPSDVLPR